MGLFDKTCSAETMMAYPQLYKPSQSGELFNVKVFWVWVVNGMIHSAILYWLPLLICQNDILWMNGKEGGYLVLGNCVYTVSIRECRGIKMVFTKIFVAVCRCYCMLQSRLVYEFVDVAHALCYMGFDIYMVLVYYCV